MKLPLTCVLPVYAAVSPAEFTRAYRSIVYQTCPPEEILVVVDGPVDPKILEYLSRQPDSELTLVRFQHNSGVAAAMRAGFVQARHRWVARHDADDILMPDRFEKQWPLVATGEYAAVGGAMLEFVGTPSNVVRVRRLPVDPVSIAKYVKINSPLNNQSTIFDREAVLSVGNVRDICFLEDYDLFARLIAHGYQLCNIDEPLVLVHAQESMYDRRTDMRVAKAERELQRNLINLGLISYPRAVFNYIARQVFRKLPRPLLKYAYRKLFHRPGILTDPTRQVRNWEDSGWPGLHPDPDYR